MKKFLHTGIQIALMVTGIWVGVQATASALPGQSVQEAEAWMQAHPTLRAEPRERLSIRRNDTPSRRYTFHGSVFGPGGGSGESLLLRERSSDPVMVRSEKFTLVDLISGVSITRLEDALRTLYGAEIYADYRRSQTVMVYSPGRPEDRGTYRASRAQLSEGDIFAYLIEVSPNPDGTIHTGGVTVMLKDDVPALQLALRNREINRREFEEPTSEPSVSQPSTIRDLRNLRR
ncbi:MAG: hypothetical protein HC800_17835 [Phormidesmis sp. RL_2_1]|nr:hypothetical protein [Phormidesmis sp. RL_2_1]